MTDDGSTATTTRSAGSYDPVPAPTFSTVRSIAERGMDPRVDRRIGTPMSGVRSPDGVVTRRHERLRHRIAEAAPRVG